MGNVERGTWDIEHLQMWLGKTVEIEDTLMLGHTRLMAATVNDPTDFKQGDSLPPTWHWLYFHEATPTPQLGPDGHAPRGGFLPPVPLPRRMWAGSRFIFSRPLTLGQKAIRRSTIKSITSKQGRSGQLCFVVVAHEIKMDGELCLTEEQDLVYREAPQPGASATEKTVKPASSEAVWSERVQPNPVWLFRYSALTFNGHRIHYDVDYCREVEGYPGLVVHGPLIATLLLDQFRHRSPDSTISTFNFRAMSPLYDVSPFTLNGNEGHLWAANHDGGLAMQAEVTVG